jgi:RHS repeat-associated protein
MTRSKRSLRLLCILLLTSRTQLIHAQTNWPMPGHDAQHSGRANFAGPTSAPAAPSWTFPTAAPLAGDIVASAEGTLYFASDQLYALNPGGTAFAPSVSIGVPATGPVVDDSSGLVYIAVSAVDGGFDLLSFTKQLQGRIVVLHVPRPPNGAIISPLVLGRGGLVFFVAGRFPGVVYAAGPLQWSNPVCPGEAGPNTPFGVSANSPVVSTDGSTLFVMCGGGSGSQDGLSRLQASTGTVIASNPTNRNSVEPALDSLLHVRSGWQAFGGAVFCGDYLTWDFSLTLLTTPAVGCDSSRFTTSRPAIFADGQSTVRIGFAFPPNNQLDAEGINNWIFGTDGSTVPNFTSLPSVDAAGNVFIGNTQGIEALSAIDGHILWSFSTGDQITTQPVVANGGALYVGSSSGKVYAFNTAPAHQNGTVYVSGSGAGFATVDLLRASVTATNNTFTDGGVIAVSPDGTRSYASAILGLAVVDNTTNQVLTTISVGSRPEWVALSPDGSRIYVSQPNISSVPGVLQGVYVIDAATNAIIASIPVPGPQRLAVAPDNSRVYVGSGGRGIAVIDPTTNTVVHSIDIPGAQTTGIAFTPNGAHAYAGEFNAPFLYVIDAHADALLQTIPLTASLGGGISGVITSPDGSKVYAGNVRNSPFVTAPRDVFVIDTATNAVTGQIPVSFPSPQFAISSDGANLLVGDSDIGSLIVASIATNSVVESIHINNPCCPGITGIGAAPPAAVVQPPTPLPVVPPSLGPPGPTNPQGVSAEPVSTGNGNYLYHHTDLAIPGRGTGLRFERTYNALDSYSGPLGANWTHNYNVTLAHNQTTAQIKWGDGHGETFALSGMAFIPSPGVHSSLVANVDGTFLLTRKDQVKFLFSALGKLTSIADRNGNTIQLSYDANRNLIQIADTVGRTLVLTYDGGNRITQIVDAIGRKTSFAYDGSNNLASTMDPAGEITQYSYDGSHRVTSIILPNGNTLLQNTYDAQGRVTTQKNGRGFAWTYAYGSPAVGQTTITDPRGNTTIHTYDPSLRIIAITDALGGTTAFAYDSQNNKTNIKDANSHATNFTYDAQGNLLSATDANGNARTFTYDSLNDLLTATTPKGNTTTFTYDSVGNLTAFRDALGNVTKFVYDLNGQLEAKTDANNHATNFTYDSTGNLTQITDALGQKRTLAYDAVGRLTSATDANGHTGTVTFDVLNRITKIADPLGNATQFGFDAIGNLLSLTDANGHTTAYTYDLVNNPVTVIDALGHVTQYSYDSANNRTALKNAKLNTTAFAYDALNRLASISDPLGNTTAYIYDPVGNLIQKTDANGTANRFVYDALDRLTGIAYGDGKTVNYVYDPDSHRLSMIDSTGTATYAYDADGRLISVTAPGNKAVAYDYDAVGNRIGLKYPDATSLSYGYDAANRLAQVTDWLLRATNYTYDPANNLSKTAYPNGASVSFSFDASNRLTNVINTASDGTPMLNLAYTLDPTGNRIALSANGITTSFGYDAINELASAQIGTLTSTWTYDAVGNRIKQALPTGATDYLYDSADRLLQAGTRLFTYDRNGNQLSAASGVNGTPVLYTYNAANQLSSARAGTKINSSFVYDGDGNRVAQTTRKGTYAYVNDVAAQLPVVLQESGPDGQITYAHGTGLIEEFSSSFNYFYHPDGLGSTIALTNRRGEPEAVYIYDAWGNAIPSSSDDLGTRNKFRFTGEALDPETQLYFLRARYFDPTVGRFLSEDPFPGIVQYPLTLAAYPYALNNPVVFRDPSGMSVLDNVAKATADAYASLPSFLACSGSFFNAVGSCKRQGFSDLEIALGKDAGTIATAAILGEPGLLAKTAIESFATGAQILSKPPASINTADLFTTSENILSTIGSVPETGLYFINNLIIPNIFSSQQLDFSLLSSTPMPPSSGLAVPFTSMVGK